MAFSSYRACSSARHALRGHLISGDRGGGTLLRLYHAWSADVLTDLWISGYWTSAAFLVRCIATLCVVMLSCDRCLFWSATPRSSRDLAFISCSAPMGGWIDRWPGRFTCRARCRSRIVDDSSVGLSARQRPRHQALVDASLIPLVL